MKSLYYFLIAISRTLHLVCVTTECIALTMLINHGHRPNEFVTSGVRDLWVSQHPVAGQCIQIKEYVFHVAEA